VGEFYGVDSGALREDLRWLRHRLFAEHDYRNQEVIDRLYSVRERADTIDHAQQAGGLTTWHGLSMWSDALAKAMETYRDKHPEGAPFPFHTEPGTFGIYAGQAEQELPADE
jgi:hypothetical protein